MKDILVISNFCAELSDTSNGRFQYICERLAEKGNKVELISSDFHHGKKNREVTVSKNLSFAVTLLHEMGYKKNISIRRLISHSMWSKEIEKYLKSRAVPDVIYVAIPPLTGALAAERYCKKNGIPCIIDIQDLWPEAFQMVFNFPVISNIVFFPFKRIADGIYKRADAICGVSRTYVERALKVNRKCKEGYVVFLGTSLETFDKNARNNPVSKPKGELWLGYCGSLNASYDLTVVIDALAILKEKGIVPPKFMVFGDGERRKEFEQRAREKGVDCLFTGRLPYDRMCGWLSACDIAVNPIVGRSAASIINKHADYASAGLPVLNTQDSVEYRNLVEEYNMGFNCANGNADDLAEKLGRLVKSPELCSEMGRNARRCAEERFDRAATYSLLINCILNA